MRACAKIHISKSDKSDLWDSNTISRQTVLHVPHSVQCRISHYLLHNVGDVRLEKRMNIRFTSETFHLKEKKLPTVWENSRRETFQSCTLIRMTIRTSYRATPADEITHHDECPMRKTGHLGPCLVTRHISTKSGMVAETTAYWATGAQTTHIRTF